MGNLSRDGYTFAGWNTEDDGSGITYPAGTGKFTITNDIHLYAKWTINTYTLTYVGNGNTGGSVPSTGSPYDSNTTITVTANTGNLTRTGYDFNDWNTAANGSGTGFVAGAPLKIKSDTTLYAQWTIKQYTVTYLGNNQSSGSAPVDATPHDSNFTVAVLGNTGGLERDGYRFAGWNTDMNGSGTTYIAGSSIPKIRSDTTLYALWEKLYSCMYICNNMTSGAVPGGTYHDFNTTVTVAANTGNLKRIGYVFYGWNTAEDGSGTNYTAGTGAFNIQRDTSLFARWVIMDADSNIYTEVKIGSQTWVVENLKTTKYRNGDDIPLVEDSAAWATLTSAGYCWYGNHPAWKEPFGALYNWYAVHGNLAPEGWHVPSTIEYGAFTDYLMANGFNWDNSTSGNKFAKSLAAKTHWTSSTDIGTVGNDMSTNNRTEFTALPGGSRDIFEFNGLFDSGFWWLNDEWEPTTGCYFGTYPYYEGFDTYCGMEKTRGISVRCIRDY